MILLVVVQFILYESGKMRAEDAGFMGRPPWSVVTDDWILAHGDAEREGLRLATEMSVSSSHVVHHEP